VQLVLRHRVHTAVGHEPAVVAVDHLPEDEGLRVVLSDAAGERRQEAGRDGVRGIQSPAVGAAGEPVSCDSAGPLQYRLAPVIEGDQLALALEVAVAEAVAIVAGEVQPEPVGIRRASSTGHHVAKRGEGPPDMVEDAIEDHLEVARVAVLHERREVVVVPEALIDPERVDSVVPVRPGDEHRREQHAATPKRGYMIEPTL
jgi:hypothetical protein